jgi:hypothetical protein
MDGVQPSFDGRPTVDGYFVLTSEGRWVQLVDYCLPILPLPTNHSGVRDNYPYPCPATIDDAIVDMNGTLDAHSGWLPTIAPCSEGLFAYLPYAMTAGTICFYSTESRSLIALTYSTDIPVECSGSDTAAFVYAVYGQFASCSIKSSIAVDAGGDQIDTQAADGSIVADVEQP